jgi:hypothetical protein
MDLQTLSSFALARLLNDAAEGSAFQRAVQEELHNRYDNQYKDNKTPWLFNEEALKAMRKRFKK